MVANRRLRHRKRGRCRGYSRRARLFQKAALIHVNRLVRVTWLVAACWIAAAAISTAAGEPIRVPAGGDLQAAINQARSGDRVLLAPGATYTGNFILPVHGGDSAITIATDVDDTRVPGRGRRIAPEHAPLLAKLKSPNGNPALRTAPAARHWRLELVEVLPAAGASADLIQLGDGGSAQRDAAAVPRDLAIDRCYIHGDKAAGQKRGIALNSGRTAITGSHFSDFKLSGADSQAIAGWNGTGPYLIENNYLEASGEGFLLGGADPWIAGLVPADVTFRRNVVSRPVAWRQEKWQVKNLFELKNARRVLVERNLFENNWSGAQSGFAIVITPRNQDGRAPWSTVEDVTFRGNIVRNAGGGVNILGRDNERPSGVARGVRIAHSIFTGIDAKAWGGSGIFLQIGEAPEGIVVEHNTVIHSGNVISVYGGTRERPAAVRGFVFRDNLLRHNRYGVHGQDRAPGNDTLSTFFPNAVFICNALAGGHQKDYPEGNWFPSEQEFRAQFVGFDAGDYRLREESMFRGAACDGTNVGAGVDEILEEAGKDRGPRKGQSSPRLPAHGSISRLTSCAAFPVTRPCGPRGGVGGGF